MLSCFNSSPFSELNAELGKYLTLIISLIREAISTRSALLNFERFFVS